MPCTRRPHQPALRPLPSTPRPSLASHPPKPPVVAPVGHGPPRRSRTHAGCTPGSRHAVGTTMTAVRRRRRRALWGLHRLPGPAAGVYRDADDPSLWEACTLRCACSAHKADGAISAVSPSRGFRRPPAPSVCGATAPYASAHTLFLGGAAVPADCGAHAVRSPCQRRAHTTHHRIGCGNVQRCGWRSATVLPCSRADPTGWHGSGDSCRPGRFCRPHLALHGRTVPTQPSSGCNVVSAGRSRDLCACPTHGCATPK